MALNKRGLMWSVVDRYLRAHPKFWGQHQQESFADFKDRRLLKLVQEKVKCDRVKWVDPPLSAEETLARGGTFAGRLYAVEGKVETFLGTVPAPQADGWFIVSGRETCMPIEEVASAGSLVWAGGGVGANGLTVYLVPDTPTEEHGEFEVVFPDTEAARVPLFVAMRALGVLSDKSICEYCLVGADTPMEARLRPSVHAAGRIYTIAHARAYLDSVLGKDCREVLKNVTPHQIGYLVGQILTRAPPSEGSMEGRSVVLCGQVLETWVREELAALLTGKPKERTLEAHCASDELGAKLCARFTLPDQTATPSFFERVARVRSVTSSNGGLHGSHWGYYDAAESDGSQQQLALLTRVTTGAVSAEEVLKLLPVKALVPLKDVAMSEHRRLVRVVVDGVWTVSTSDPEGVLAALLTARRAESKPKDAQGGGGDKIARMDDVNFHWDTLRRELHIRTREGRVQRPLFYVDTTGQLSCDDMPATWKWTDAGGVDYLDCAEAAHALIAVERKDLTPRNTHLEVHPSLLLGIRTNIASVLPEHTPFAGVQALSRVVDAVRTPRTGDHTETPLVHSGYYAAAACAPYGVNAVVAVCSAGYGSDGGAILLNQGAVERGFFRSVAFRTYAAQMPVGSPVAYGDELAPGVLADVNGFVDRSSAGKIRVKYLRRAEAGDRFFARNGATYVCGGILPEADMPCTQNGLRPHAILPLSGEASAASLLLEALMGRVHTDHGSFGDGTAFGQKARAAFYFDALKQLGDDRKARGDDAMVHGAIGSTFASPIFWGSIYLAPLATDPLHVQARGEVSATTRQPLRGVEFDETARDACLAHGMTAVLQDAHMARSDGTCAVVDGISGTFAFCAAGGGMVAPAVDGPIDFDGALNPSPCRATPFNTFTGVRLPRAFRTLTQELALANVSLRLVTAPVRLKEAGYEEVRGLYRAMRAVTPEHLGNDFAASMDRALCLDPRWRFPAKPHPTLFPVVTTPDWLKTLVATSLQIAPTADMRPAQFNADKLDCPMYSGMDWRSARHTLKYCFDRANSGVFVRIQDNRLVNFDPLGNQTFSNDFLQRLSLDGAKAATPEALREALQAPFPARWTAVGRMLRLDTAPSDRFLAQLFDLLTETCSHRAVQDCFFVVNRSDHPMLGMDGAEAYPTFYGPEKKLDPVWKSGGFIPILSPCTSPAHADVPIPTADDWEAVTGKYFAAHRRGDLECENRYPSTPLKNWADRDASVELETGRRLPIFFWTGTAVLGDPKHPRHLLEKAADDYARRGRRSDITKSGLLKVYPLPPSKHRVSTSYDAATKLTVVHPNPPRKKTSGDAPPTSLAAQAANYKFVFHVEGNGASGNLGALFHHGFCVLHVESPFALWCSDLVRGGDAEEYQPDWCYLKIRRDLSNLDSTVEWCLEHDDECRRIAENGRRAFDTYFTPAYMYDYMSSTLNSISSRQRGTELTPDEMTVRNRDVQNLYGKSLVPEWHPFAAGRGAGTPPHTVLLVAVCRGPHETAELAQFLKHYQSRNVLVVKGGLNAPRGGLYNAAVHFVRKHAPDIAAVLFLNLGARFRPDFAKSYFAAGDPGVLDFGRLVSMPVGWATKFSLGAYVDCNGFPNSAGSDLAAESAAVLERLYRVRKTWTCCYPDGATDVMSANLPVPPATVELTADSQAAVLRDRMHWRMDGLNTVHYRVTEHVEGDWTASPKTPSPNLRTITVQLVPETSINTIPTTPAYPPPQQQTEKPPAAPVIVHVDLPAEDEPPVINEIIVINDDDRSLEPARDVLPTLENTESLSPTDAVTTKIITFDAK